MSRMPRRQASLLSLPALALLIAACSGGGGSASPAATSGASDAPSPASTATPGADTIDHPTGATDVILRYDIGAGFMMAGFAATMVPPFTLYGDGTIIFRDPMKELPPAEGSVSRSNPLRTAKLTEEQVQDVLSVALDAGGLANARPEYRYDMVTDASTAIFTVQAAGTSKTVSVYALGMDDPNMPDRPVRQALGSLAQRLTTIEDGGVIVASDYTPTSYRGVLLDSPGMVAPDMRAWPWPDIAPADFAPAADPDGLQFPHRAMTIEEIEALGIEGYEGGLQNVPLTAPDGKLYTFSLRPLLPDETS